MAGITLIEKSQIRDAFSFTGNYLSTGFSISGGVGFSGAITGQSGNFLNLSTNTLDVSGPIRSQYLSGFLGINTSGVAILHFAATPDIQSGNNVHFRAVFSTGNPSNPIQVFSSETSQAEWQYFSSPSWNAFPALGLNNLQAQSSVVRLMFSPTGFITTNTYYVSTQTLFAGGVTGAFTNSLQFRVNTNGFTLVEVPILSSLFENIDDRFVRKQNVNGQYIASGVSISGIPIIIQNFPSIPSTNRGTGNLINVSGRIFNYHEVPGFSGYIPVSFVTGIQSSSGGAVISGANPTLIFSGMGQASTSIIGNNIVGISGGVNSFALATQSQKRGDIIFSGIGGTSITFTNSSSGTIIGISGGAGGGGGGQGNVTGFSANLDTVQFTGGMVISGVNGIATYMTNLAPNISGIIISGSSTSLSEFDSDQLIIQIFNTVGY